MTDPRDARTTPTVRVSKVEGLPAALDELAVRRGRPVLVLVGGAGGMDDAHLEIVRALLVSPAVNPPRISTAQPHVGGVAGPAEYNPVRGSDQRLADARLDPPIYATDFRRGTLVEVVFPLLDRRGAAVIDGGTDSGVMQVIGRARVQAEHRFPLVGVAAEGTVDTGYDVPTNPDAAALEPHHTHFGLGRLRPVLVLAGTGRVANAIADARSDGDADPRATAISASPLTFVLPVTDRAGVLGVLEDALSR